MLLITAHLSHMEMSAVLLPDASCYATDHLVLAWRLHEETCARAQHQHFNYCKISRYCESNM
jgi:hypothetical protein